MSTHTPMMQQYLKIKAEHQDAFLFFRLGDFYEMFFEDATEAARILEITLTSRDSGNIPMCGVPYHSAQGYIETLVRQGYKVAICEQVEDPRTAKGVVRREVVKIVTPGTITEGKTVDSSTNHFIGSADMIEEGLFALAYMDLSTGEGTVRYVEGDERSLLSEMDALNMKEIVVGEQLQISLSERISSSSIVLSVEIDQETSEESIHDATVPRNTRNACRKLVAYVRRTQKNALDHIKPFVFIEKKASLSIDANSMRNLELVQSIRSGGKKGTLYWLLDETVTAMGARKLKRWIHQPLADREEIDNRLDTVSELIEDYFLRDTLRNELKNVYDLERLAGKVAMGNAGGRDLAQLRNSLRRIPSIRKALAESSGKLRSFAEQINPCDELKEKLEQAIAEEPPISVKEGGVIKDGFNETLDTYRDAARNGKQWLAELEQIERDRTGIKSLKIGYNRVFGYFIEITKSNIHLADLSRYERKQTLANAERYITPELKEKEDLILRAESEGEELEYTLFVQVREDVKTHIREIQNLASVLSELDVLLSFADVSEKGGYVRPTFHDGRALEIKNGRHPVVEKMMDHSLYVPNSCQMTDDANMLLITGPNMSGKSTYMRQVALTVVMAQIGCYVPCEDAVLPITDQIFTRIGAADDLASGQSTFMMEMLESQHAIANATSRSLLLFDEIGRGTSTYDGMALAQAMMEHIHNEIGANTLFSTHYHELTKLDQELERLVNIHVAAMEQDGKVVFLHKVMSGAADKSYGIHVADLAGLPEPLLKRAKDLLIQFEQASAKAGAVAENSSEQLSFFELIEENDSSGHPIEKEVLKELEEIDPLQTTPLDALHILHSVKQKLSSRKG